MSALYEWDYEETHSVEDEEWYCREVLPYVAAVVMDCE